MNPGSRIELGDREDQASKMREMALIAEKNLGKSCKKCSGRGFESWSNTMNQYLPCSCVHKAMLKVSKEKLQERIASGKKQG